MRNLNPVQEEVEARRKREEIELCGKNRGPHDYIPIQWKHSIKDKQRLVCVTQLLCRVCFNTVATSTLLENYRTVNS